MVHMMRQHFQKWVFLLPACMSGLCLVLCTLEFSVSASGAFKICSLAKIWCSLGTAGENPREVREAYTTSDLRVWPSLLGVWPSLLGSCYFIWVDPASPVEEQLPVVDLQVKRFCSKTSILTTEKWWFILPCSFWELHAFQVMWLWQN